MQQERRRYFRVNDAVGVYFQTLSTEQATSFRQELLSGSPQFDYASHFDNRIHTLLESCRVQSPLAAELIDLLNKKLNLVIAQLDMDTELMHKTAYTMREVNVSACGMAFAVENPPAANSQLELALMLYPQEIEVSILARVVAVEPCSDDADDPRQFIRLDYEAIRATDQEVLIQHIVRRQGTLLKQRRQQQQQ